MVAVKLSGALLAAGAAVSAEASEVHPIQNVINQMNDSLQESKDRDQSEAQMQTGFARTCTKDIATHSEEIAKQTALIEQNHERSEGLANSIASLGEGIKALDKEITKRGKDQATADGLRSDELAANTQIESDFQGTLDAITEVLGEMESAAQGAEDKNALLQTRGAVKNVATMMEPFLSAKDNGVLRAFIQAPGGDNDSTFGEDRGKNVMRTRTYDFKSNSVIGLLKKMQESFESKVTDTQVAETNALNTHTLATQSMDAAIKAAKGAKTAKETQKQNDETSKGEADQAKADATTALGMAHGALDSTTGDCRDTQQNYDARVAARAQEQAGLKEAVRVLGEVTGVRSNAHKTTSANRGEGVEAVHGDLEDNPASFLQLARRKSKKELAQAKAAALIAKIAKTSHSAVLQALASRVLRAPKRTDAFRQIINTIQKMVFQLNKEQTDEDSHQQWCKNELTVSIDDRDVQRKNEELAHNARAKLRAQLEKNKTNIETTDSNIATLEEEKATRAEENATEKKELTVDAKDAKKASAAIQQAISLVAARMSGARSEKGTTSGNVEQDMGSGAKAGDAGTRQSGVITLLEKLAEDYISMATRTESQNQERELSYAKYQQAAKKDRGFLDTTLLNLNGKRGRLTSGEAASHKKFKNAEKQHNSLNIYLNDLRTNCGQGETVSQKGMTREDIGSTQWSLTNKPVNSGMRANPLEGGHQSNLTWKAFEDRKAARTQEIKGLGDAQKILNEAFGAAQAFLARN